MRRNLIAISTVTAALLLAACGEPVSDEHVIDEPATLTEIENQGKSVV